jgi:hypothetical protein
MRAIVTLLLMFLFSGAMLSQVDMGRGKQFITFGNMFDHQIDAVAHSQIVFFYVPESFADHFFLRVFDPDCGGLLDRPEGLWETNSLFEVYGGDGCISGEDARRGEPQGDYKSGTLLHSALFAKESEMDGEWFAFGPFTSGMGESLEDFSGYRFFKLVVEGRTGNDGNVYLLSVSRSNNDHIKIDHAGTFDYRRLYLQGDSLVVDRHHVDQNSETGIILPVALQPLKRTPEFNIIAEPIEE